MLSFEVRSSNEWDKVTTERAKWAAQRLYDMMSIKVDVKLIIGNIRNSRQAGYCCDKRDTCNMIEVMISTKRHSKRSIKEIFDTLAHEFIHVRQYDSGDMKWDWDGDLVRWIKTWKGVEYSPMRSSNNYKKMDTKENVQYKELPWEAEAFGNSDKYAELLLEELKAGPDGNVPAPVKRTKPAKTKCISVDGKLMSWSTYYNMKVADMRAAKRVIVYGNLLDMTKLKYIDSHTNGDLKFLPIS